MALTLDGTNGVLYFGGVKTSNTYSGTLSTGIALDYSSGLGRLSVGTTDTLSIYTGGLGNTQVASFTGTGLNSTNIGVTIPGSGTFNALSITGNTTLGDASGDTVTLNAGTVTLNNSTSLSAASTRTLTLNGGGGTNGLVLDASNNVGIGVAPTYRLDVANNSTNIIARLSSAYVYGTAIQLANSSTGGGTWTLYSFGQSNGEGAGNFGIANISGNKLTLDSSGNLGLGVTPKTYSSGTHGFDLGAYGVGISDAAGYQAVFANNAYYNGGWKYKVTGYAAAIYAQNTGSHAWFTAPSGTADVTFTPTQAMTLDASGNLLLGTPSSYFNSANRVALEVNGGVDSAIGMKIANSVYGYLYSSTAAFRIANFSNNPITFYTNNTEKMQLDASGNLLVAQTSASYTTLGASIRANGSVNSASASDFWNAYSTAAGAYRFYVTNVGTVYATNTTISAISDQRLKENIQDLDVGLNAILALKPRKFDWRAGKGKDIKGDRGFIAQEFEEVFPDLIDTWKDPAPEGEEPYKSVRQDLIPVLVKAIQELTTRLETLEARIN